MASLTSEKATNLAGLLPDVVAGIGVGLVVDAVALEGWVHQSMSHRNTAYDPTLATASRVAMVATGMSPNRAALNHRVHHGITDVEPQGYVDSVREAFDFTGGDSSLLGAADEALLFPGYTYDDDPLIRQRYDGSLAFRHDPFIEKLSSKGIPSRIVPVIATTAMIGLANKYLGRDRPFTRAALLMGTSIISLGSAVGLISYGEARSGKVNGQMPIRGLLKVNLSRHQEHHDRPDDMLAGSRRRDRFAFRLLERAGLVTKTPPKQDA
jgi:hypothetical protein